MGTERATVAAFVAIVVLGGFNGVEVRALDRELAPLWGASLRFAIAAAILLVVVAARGIPLPRGRALLGSLLYGLTAFAGAFGFIHVALVRVPAGVGQVILALVPLLTFILAVVLTLERFRWLGLAGSAIALVGVVIVASDGAGADAPFASVLEMVAAAGCMAASNVIAKRFPACHPVANNAIAMGVGAAVLGVASLLSGERRQWPTDVGAWAALAYLSIVGSVVVFSLFRVLIGRWRASAASYVMLLMPLVSIAAAAILAGEPISARLLGGGGVVLAGVYVGALARIAVRAPTRASAPATAVSPGCA
ncbi:MAG TPA: EamA family transporter [Candidatus Limnocylindrales bacterium]|nr:EamA family transporter [Candidatus Limnocylindrales bacterium]